MTYKKSYILATALLIFSYNMLKAQENWRVEPVQLQTRWAKDVTPDKPLNEYPRPQLTRPNWANLNGLWDYAITNKDAAQPTKWDGKLLVPYPIESALSGIKKQLLPSQNLWYKRTFNVPKGERTLLHFGALDWQATIYVNGKEAGAHTGGYAEFTIDISDKLKPGSNELAVKVYDPTEQGIGPSGKQVLNPENIYYTPTSGIWQTVWLEEVPKDYIQRLTITPDVDSNYVAVTVHCTKVESVKLKADGKEISGQTNIRIKFPVTNVHLWSPEDPYLYDLTVKTKTDEVKSYFGMRKISIAEDEKGVDRIFLNNRPYYNLGVLDQGFWPEGLYTAPTDEALAFDIKAIKAMGFNTIRKHIKVEPARWYYWADKLGMLVWQDMVNPNQGLPEGSKPEFERESAEELAQLHNYPCITTWVLFNEKWGQYDQKRLTDWLKAADPSRIVNGHTGELLYVNEQLRSPSPDAYIDADMTDVHSYPNPMMPIIQTDKARVVGEFGGIGLAVPGHEWNPYTGWGYIQTTAAQLPGKYASMVEELKLLEQQGLSGSIYTQPYDVEGEENGLMTYDRDYIKIPLKQLQQINSELVPIAPNLPTIEIKDNDKNDEAERYAAMLKDYIHGNRDTTFLKALAMTAQKQSDRDGGQAAADSYIETLKAPFGDDQIKFIANFTRTSNDPGFAIMQSNELAFKHLLGDRLHSDEMNAIYAGEIGPVLETAVSPDWPAIKLKIAPYGKTGEEIWLRAQVVNYINAGDWPHYVPVATLYLKEYGDHVNPNEKQQLQAAIDQHKIQ